MITCTYKPTTERILEAARFSYRLSQTTKKNTRILTLFGFGMWIYIAWRLYPVFGISVIPAAAAMLVLIWFLTPMTLEKFNLRGLQKACLMSYQNSTVVLSISDACIREEWEGNVVVGHWAELQEAKDTPEFLWVGFGKQSILLLKSEIASDVIDECRRKISKMGTA